MADLVLRDTDRNELIRDLTKQLMVEIQRVLTEASEPRLVDRHRMAELLGVSLSMLDGLVSKDRIPSVLINSRRMFLPAAVLESLVN